MAAPHVTGVAALAWSTAPDATYQEIKDAILAGVDPIPALNGITVTGGRLNALNSLKQLGISVSSTDPVVDSIVFAPPTQYVVDFSLPYDPTSIDASDFTVNGVPADVFTLTDADSVTFTFSLDPVTAQGLQTMAIAAGAIDPGPGAPPLPFLGFRGTFRYDALPLEVVATTPPFPGGKFVLPGPFTYDVHFDEPVDPNSVAPSDLALSGLQDATVSAVSVSADSMTATFTISGIHDEGTLTASIPAGAITDAYGNPGSAFSRHYIVDYGTAPYPVPLTPVAPLGSLIYDPVQLGNIDPAGDTDSFTIAVDPGQTITVLVESSASLRDDQDYWSRQFRTSLDYGGGPWRRCAGTNRAGAGTDCQQRTGTEDLHCDCRRGQRHDRQLQSADHLECGARDRAAQWSGERCVGVGAGSKRLLHLAAQRKQ